MLADTLPLLGVQIGVLASVLALLGGFGFFLALEAPTKERRRLGVLLGVACVSGCILAILSLGPGLAGW